MSKRVLTALAACCALTYPALAQDGEGHDGAGHEMDPQAMQQMMKMMQPGEHHEAMSFFEGTWKVLTENGMTGETSEGTYTFEWTLGNRCMLGTMSGTMMGQPYEGMSLDGYDNATGEYYSIWLDTMGTGYTAFTGKPEGEDTVVYSGTGTDPMSGGEVSYRAVSKRTGADSFSYALFMMQGGQEMKLIEMTGTRM